MVARFSVIGLIAISVISFSSCKCETKANGVVYDAVSQLPLDSVRVRTFISPQNFFLEEHTTTSDGIFSGTTGTSSKCKELKLTFVRDGYKDQIITYASGESHDNQQVYLELE